MKQLRIDVTRCGGGDTCARECEEACARQVFKLDDPALAALQVGRRDGQVAAVLCDQCGDCAVVCPAGALARNRLGAVTLDRKRCVGCFICVGFCGKNAFRRTPGRLEPHKCTSCGICVKACPEGALELVDVPEPAPRII
jgi:Fe-S-cluster-containing hydrogenase component 2